MKKSLLFVLAAFAFQTAQAQFGLTGAYRSNNAPVWITPQGGDQLSEDALPDAGFSAGIDYWFRLKNARVEFLPEINYARFRSTPEESLTVEGQMLSFFGNVNFYLLDLAGDCDCPTFSKEGGFFEKGFFVQLSPGISRYSLQVNTTNEEITDHNWLPSLGAALGIDIGLVDQITLSPTAGLRYFFNADWETLQNSGVLAPGGIYRIKDGENSIMQFFAGLRIGIRLNN
jgi:hypothetical protein